MSFAIAYQSKINNPGDVKSSTAAKHSSTHHHINKSDGDSHYYVHNLQRTIGDQVIERLMRSDKVDGFDFATIGILQPKLKVSQPNDPYEQEADRVAEEVMRTQVPDTTSAAVPSNMTSNKGKMIDRKCSSCEVYNQQKEEEQKEYEKLRISRRAFNTSHTEITDRAASEISNIRSSSGGYPLDASTSLFMESRFGYDFGNIRIHSDAVAARSANSVNALAYTIGNDIVFGEGRYQPNSPEGKRLLAHELTHVVQRTPVPMSKMMIWRQFQDEGDGEEVNSEPLVEIGRSTPVLWFKFNSTELRQDVEVDSKVHLQHAVDAAKEHIRIAGNDTRIILHGYASEEGGAAHNQTLSNARGEAIRNRLIEEGIRPDMITVIGHGEDSSWPGRRWNRRVEVELSPEITTITFPPEEITPIRCESPTAATSLDEYIELVVCAERAAGLSSRDMLSLLRQIYYGNNSWSNSRTRFWDDVIPCHVGFRHPSSIMGTPLFEALRASQVVAGIDIGHVFTGLESMVCPSPTVELEVTGPNPLVQMSNEEFATWGGDLGSAAARRTFDEADKGLRKGWPHYFGTPGALASFEDLKGDIDAWAIRAGMVGRSCGSTALVAIPSIRIFTMTGTPVSDILADYYLGMASSGPTVSDRYRCFAQAIGAMISGNRIVNKSALVTPIRNRVKSFAEIFYLGLVTVPLFAIGALEGMLLLRYSWEITELFLDWIESRL